MYCLNKRRTIQLACMIGILAISATAASSKTIDLEFTRGEIRAIPNPQDSLQTLFILKFDMPERLTQLNIDGAYLEFFVDASHKAALTDRSVLIEVYPLSSDPNGTGSIDFEKTRAVRNVNLGTGKRVVMDVTDVIQDWHAGRRQNHGLVIGGLSGAKDGRFVIRADKIGRGVAARLRIQYHR